MFNWFLRSSKSRPAARTAPASGRSAAAGSAAAGSAAAGGSAAGGASDGRRPVDVGSREDLQALARLPAWARQLHPQAQLVLASLPASIRLARGGAQYPHAVEKLLLNWASPSDFRRILDSMMIDTRGGRQGFPFDVVTEFSELREYYDRYVHPVSTSAWASVDTR